MVALRVYIRGAPSWWRFQLALDPVDVSCTRCHVFVDNGGFGFWRDGRPPRYDLHWRRVVAATRRLLASGHDVVVVLPDFPWDPLYTITNAKSWRARELCVDTGVRCYAVAQAPPSGTLRDYRVIAEMLASIDWVSGLCAPAKLQCRRRHGSRWLTDRRCQLAITEQVCTVAREHGLQCHVLGAILEPTHVRRLWELGATSIDSASWTRPNPSTIRRILGDDWRSRYPTLRDAFAALLVLKLTRAVPVEGADALQRLTNRSNR